MKSKTQLYFLAILLITTLISSCYGTSPSLSDKSQPGDPDVIVETFTPTPDPLIAGTLKIHREVIITGGAGGSLDVTGEIPLKLLYRDSAFAGDDLVDTTGDGIGTSIMLGSGTVGSGDITGIWEVTYVVRGILHPAPKCDVELWIEENWGETVDVTATINGQEIITTVATTDIIPMVKMEDIQGHVTIPKGQNELVEYTSQPSVDWISTYTIQLTPLTKFEGCLD